MRVPALGTPPAYASAAAGGPAHHALVWGTGRGVEEVLALFERHPRRGWRAAAAYATDGEPDLPPHVERLQRPPGPAEVSEIGSDAVVFALPPSALRAATAPGTRVVSGRDLVECWERKIPVEFLDPAESEGWTPTPLSRAARRALDVVLALPAAVLVLPLVALLAGIVRLESRGPAFYTQLRTGEGGRPFRIWKLRSMVQGTDREEPRATDPADERITRAGRFLRRWRLDELPQLWNVLRGEMSLVGPRPEQPEILEEFTRRLPALEARLHARPGVTGWAQVRYGYASSLDQMREKFGYDLYYLRHRSLLLDLEILARTLGVVLSGRGVR